jgi:hypothetical protein
VYKVSSQQKQYHTYTLSDNINNSHIEVVPERGGIITSWQINGKEVFYLDTERFTHSNLRPTILMARNTKLNNMVLPVNCLGQLQTQMMKGKQVSPLS